MNDVAEVTLADLTSLAWDPVPAFPWQSEIVDSLELALELALGEDAAPDRHIEIVIKDAQAKELLWANTVVAVDLFTLASPMGWKTGQTSDERFWELVAHFQSVLADAVATLQDEWGKSGDPVGSFRKRVQAAMKRHYYDAYALGRQQSDPYWGGFGSGELGAVRGLIETEYEYLRGFCAELRDLLAQKKDLPGSLETRTGLYGASLRNAYDMGITDGAQPEDTISIRAGPVKEAHCSTCPPRWGTYSLAQYEALGPPPSQWCEGYGNCKCIVTVQHAISPAIRHVLDMVRTLGELLDVQLPRFMEKWRGERPVISWTQVNGEEAV